MKRRILSMLACLCLGLTGCASRLTLPERHELEDTVLMECLGVDVGTQGVDGLAVTAASAGRPSAGDSPGREPVVLSAQADTVTAACREMQTQGRSDIFYGDVEYLLVGEDLAQRDLRNLLGLLAKDPALRLEAQVWVVRGAGAGEALSAQAEGGDAAARLSALAADAGLWSAAAPRTAREALADLTDGGSTFLPALSLDPNGELVSDGYALFRDGALAGWADREAAWGVDLLTGADYAGLLELSPTDGGKAALRLTGGRTAYSPVFQGDRLTGLRVVCRVEAETAEYRGCGPLTAETRVWLEEALARVTETRLQTALALSRDLEGDFYHLAHKAALAEPWHKAALEEQWGSALAGLTFQVEVEAELARG